MREGEILLIAPFSREAAALLEEQGLTLEDLAFDPLLENARRFARERLIRAIEGRILYPDMINPVNEVYAFVAAKLIASRVGRSMLSRLANYEAKRFMELSERLSTEKLIDLARGTFGFEFRFNNGLWVDVVSYSNGCAGIGGPKWRLVNRVVRKGYVLVNERDLRRLISEYVKMKVMETPRIELPDPLEEIAKEISDMFAKRMRKRFKRPKKGDFPPCIRELISKLRRGENLTHQARFALTAFLLNVGWSEEQVLDLFRSAPDFNERIASYQISHIAKRKYKPPSCETMKNWGLCPGDCGRRYMLEGFD